eukprot:m.94931 g.94931  ORF g.94931 m.94931 type:complete len:51 (-) comp16577_c0_seq6:56-208(-)
MTMIQVRDFKGNTALHLAACTNHISTVTLLLESGSDLQVSWLLHWLIVLH